jgi:3-oxoadipate enol-lactonase
MLPVLLIHGFPFDRRLWGPQAEFLASQAGGSRTVLVPDLPGFGESTLPAPPPQTASMEAYAEEIHKLIQSPAVNGKAIVGGLSMGGYILLALLRKYPRDVAAAMFVDTRADADSDETRANRLKSLGEIQKNGTGPFIESLLGRLLSKKAPAAVRQHTRSIMEKQSPAAIMAAQSAMARRRDQSDLIPTLTIPALILVGSEDLITPPSVAVAMQSHMPHAMLVQIVASGHLTSLEQPDAVNAALKAFLATIHEA